MDNISLYIDIAIAVVILLGIIIGAHKGFVKTVFGFCHGIASGVVAYLLTPTVTTFVKGTEFYLSLVEKAKGSVYGAVSTFLDSEPEKLLTENPHINSLFERFGSTADFILEEYKRLAAENVTDAATHITEYIVAPACSVLLTVVCFLLLFIVALILLYFIMKIFDGLSKLPVLKAFNRLFGAVLGGAIGCIAVFLLITAFEAALPFAVGADETLTVKTVAEGSYLYRIFTAVNPVALLIALIS